LGGYQRSRQAITHPKRITENNQIDMANNHSDNEKRLWEAADQFRANSELKSSEYAVPVLGLIFL